MCVCRSVCVSYSNLKSRSDAQLLFCSFTRHFSHMYCGLSFSCYYWYKTASCSRNICTLCIVIVGEKKQQKNQHHHLTFVWQAYTHFTIALYQYLAMPKLFLLCVFFRIIHGQKNVNERNKNNTLSTLKKNCDFVELLDLFFSLWFEAKT